MARQISRKPTGVVLTRVPRPKASWSFRGGGSSRLRPSSPRAVATPVRPSAWRRVSDPDAPPLEEARIVEVLDRHQVDYVLVGGMGARLHGATKLHRDFDVCPDTGRKNLGRLAEALKELGAKMRGLRTTCNHPSMATSLPASNSAPGGPPLATCPCSSGVHLADTYAG